MTQQQIESPNKCDEKTPTPSKVRRNVKGCQSKDFYNWPEQQFEDMISPLAVQQYIQQIIRKDPSNLTDILTPPEGQDLGAWKVEHLRQFCMQLNGLATKLQECCKPETCNQMTATEQWIFLCAAHKQPNECPAIDYTRHTLDGAANLLNSNKYFPSRVTIKESSVAKLGSVSRRIYRIFSHAYYHHFQVFDDFEQETYLCRRFSRFVTLYDLMSKDILIVPSDGSRPGPEPSDAPSSDVAAVKTITTEAVAPRTDIIETGSTDTVASVVVGKLEGDSNNSSQVKPDVIVKKPEEVGSKIVLTATSATTTATTTTPATITATTTATTWTPSQASTNTMVKGTSISKANPEDLVKKSDEGDNEATATTTSIPAAQARTSPATTGKGSVESEA